MLLRKSDFIDNDKVCFENLYKETFIIKNTASMFIHTLEFTFDDGKFEEFFFILNRKYSFTQIVKLIHDVYVLKSKIPGKIVSGRLKGVLETERYSVYMEKVE